MAKISTNAPTCAQTPQFGRFMDQLVKPIEDDPLTRIRNAESIDDYRDSDILWLLMGHIKQLEGTNIGEAGNMVAELQSRARRREQGAH